MLKVWFKIFYRNQKKNALNTSVNILGLTLGLAGLLIVLLYFFDEKSYNQWNPNKDQIYRLPISSSKDGIWAVNTAGAYTYFKEDIPEVESTLLVSPFYDSRLVKIGDYKTMCNRLIRFDGDFFSFFPFDIVSGNLQNFKTKPNQVAISEKMVTKLFKGKNPIGKRLVIEEENLEVALVYKIPGNNHVEPEILWKFQEVDVNWGDFQNEVFCKIPEGTDINLVKSKMDDVVLERFHKAMSKEYGMPLQEFMETYGRIKILPEQLSTLRFHHIAKSGGPEGSGNYKLIMVLLSLSILLILISCVNFINLSTASASQRAKEVGVKKTLGLFKSNLILQYVFEICIQAFVALILACILVEFLLPYFNQYLSKELSLYNPSVFGIVLLTTLCIAIIIGIVPALYLSNFKSHEVLKGNFSRSKRGVYLRHFMLSLQFLISGFFLIGVFVIYTQIDFMMSKDLGFKKDHIIVVDVYDIGDESQKYERLKTILTKNKNIVDVTRSIFVPGNGFASGTNFNYKGESFNAANNVCDYNYIDFAGITLLKGRTLSEDYAQDTITSILINETAARKVGIYDDPIGKRIQIGWSSPERDGNMEIVGMIKDYHTSGFDEKIKPMFLMHYNTFYTSKDWVDYVQIKIKPHDIERTLADIEAFWKKHIDTEYPFTYTFLDKNFENTYKRYQKQQMLFLILSSIVILMSLLGLFALATLTIQQRLKEVAIRKTLGASVKQIMLPLLKQFLKLTIWASIILVPIAYYFMQEWLNDFVYRIDMPIWPYVLTPIILLILVATVVGVKAYQATKVDLIKYLKFE